MLPFKSGIKNNLPFLDRGVEFSKHFNLLEKKYFERIYIRYEPGAIIK